MKQWHCSLDTLLPAATYTGVFLVVSSTLWYATSHASVETVVPTLWWYLGFVSVIAIVATLATLLARTPYAHRVPRVYILTTFSSWILLHLAPLWINHTTTLHYLALLTAPSTFLLLMLVAFRIRSALISQWRIYWLLSASTVLGILVLLVAPSSANYTLTLVDTVPVLNSHLGHDLIVAAGFALLGLAIAAIPLGRLPYPNTPTYSVGPKVFTPPLQATDINLIELLARIITRERRLALKRGQWLYYRAHAITDHGIVSSAPKSLEQLLTSVIAYARHHNQACSLAVELYRDTRHRYLHVVTTYTVNTHNPDDFIEYTENAFTLGGAFTVSREDRTTQLVLTFPVHW